MARDREGRVYTVQRHRKGNRCRIKRKDKDVEKEKERCKRW